MLRDVIVLLMLSFVCAVAACDEEANPFGDSTVQDQYGEFPPTSEDRVTIDQGIWGDVWLWEGDFMPVGWGEITPVAREICIFEAVREEEIGWDKLMFDDDLCEFGFLYMEIPAKLVKTVHSDERGFFETTMPPGRYSLFVKMGDCFYANRGDGDGYIQPVDVRDGEAAGIRIDITCDATF